MSAYCVGWVDGREGSNCCMVRLLLDIGSPLPCQLLSNLPIDVSVQWHFVDCSDIHQVFHYGPPSSPEEHVQEIERAKQ